MFEEGSSHENTDSKRIQLNGQFFKFIIRSLVTKATRVTRISGMLISRSAGHGAYERGENFI
jgi:hypothetical protein